MPIADEKLKDNYLRRKGIKSQSDQSMRRKSQRWRKRVINCANKAQNTLTRRELLNKNANLRMRFSSNSEKKMKK